MSRELLALIGLVAAMHDGSYWVMQGGWCFLIALSMGMASLFYLHLLKAYIICRCPNTKQGLGGAEDESGSVFTALASKFLSFFMACILAGSFLLHAHQVAWYVWAVVYLDVFILMSLLRISKETGETHASVLITNTFILLLLVTVASFFSLPSDTADLNTLQAANMAWDHVSQSAADPLVGFWGGGIAAIDAAQWNMLQQVMNLHLGVQLESIIWFEGFFIQSFYFLVVPASMVGLLELKCMQE